VRAGGAVSSVALPATTTIMVGTEVSRTSSAEISSGRRLGENSRWWRTSEDIGGSKEKIGGDNRTNAT
jgi:hypothetical protein